MGFAIMCLQLTLLLPWAGSGMAHVAQQLVITPSYTGPHRRELVRGLFGWRWCSYKV